MFVTKELAKQWLQIKHDAEDAVLELALESAQEFVAKETGLRFYETPETAEVVEYLDGGNLSLRPNALPIQSLTKVEDTADGDIEITRSYIKFTSHRIIYVGTGTQALGWAPGIKRWKATFNAGYTNSTVDTGIKGIILDLLYRWWNSRGSQNKASTAGRDFEWAMFKDSDLQKKLDKYTKKLGIG